MRELLDRLGEEDESTEKVSSEVKSKLSGWSQKDGEHIEFQSAERIPLEHVRDLGQGAYGVVDEVRCCGILVARKKILYKREQFPNVQNELNILQKLGDKHKHIIKFVGSYSQTIPGGRLLGLLLWPVAVCDLAAFLEEVSEFRGRASPTYLTSLGLHTTSRTAMMFLKRTYGCLANAISYLHDHKIRHKDLKPQNILLSKEGVYVADFGISLDFGELSQSATDGLERGTPKYFAPELEDWSWRGRPADVYSLGCIYLEITTVLCGETLKVFWGDKPFLYRKERERIQRWAEMLREKATHEQMKIYTILPLISRMLCAEPEARPNATEVVSELYKHGGTPSVLHASCCNGLSLLEELFDSVAVVKSEERQSKVQIKGLEIKVEELSQCIQELSKSKQQCEDERAALIHDFHAQAKDIAERELGFTRVLSASAAEKDRMQKEIDALRQRSWKMEKDLNESQEYHELQLKSLRLALETGEQKIGGLNLQVKKTPVLAHPSSAQQAGGRRRSPSPSPLKHEYEPSTSSEEYAAEEQDASSLSESSEEEELEDGDAPTALLKDLAEAAASRKPRTESTEDGKTGNGTYSDSTSSISETRELRGNPKPTYTGELSIQGRDTRLEDEEYRRRDGEIHSTSGEAGLSGDPPAPSAQSRPRSTRGLFTRPQPPGEESPLISPAPIAPSQLLSSFWLPKRPRPSEEEAPRIPPAPIALSQPLSRPRSTRGLFARPQHSGEESPRIAPAPLAKSRPRSTRELFARPQPSGEESPRIAPAPLAQSRPRSTRELFARPQPSGGESPRIAPAPSIPLFSRDLANIFGFSGSAREREFIAKQDRIARKREEELNAQKREGERIARKREEEGLIARRKRIPQRMERQERIA